MILSTNHTTFIRWYSQHTRLAYGQKISAGAIKKGRLLSIGQRVAKQTIASFLPGNFNFGNGHKYVIWLRYLLA